MATHIIHKISGSKSWAIVTSNSPRELTIIARQLHIKIHQKGDQQPPHLDLNLNQVKRIK